MSQRQHMRPGTCSAEGQAVATFNTTMQRQTGRGCWLKATLANTATTHRMRASTRQSAWALREASTERSTAMLRPMRRAHPDHCVSSAYLLFEPRPSDGSADIPWPTSGSHVKHANRRRHARNEGDWDTAIATARQWSSDSTRKEGSATMCSICLVVTSSSLARMSLNSCS